MVNEQACKTPLVELLRAVPRDAMWVFNDVMSSSIYPVGRLCHEAADEIAVRGYRISELKKACTAWNAEMDAMTKERDEAWAENARLLAANRDLQAWFDAARGQSARFGDALHAIVNRCEGTARRIASGSLASSEGMPSKESDK